MNKDQIVCPLCNSPELLKVRDYKIEDCLNHLRVFPGDLNYQKLFTIVNDLWGRNISSLFQCNNCSLHFANPFISGNAEFYNLIYDENEYSPSWKWDFEITYNKLSDLVINDQEHNDRLLEIGAGDGSFLHRISNSLISPRNILATEYSDYGIGKVEDLDVTCLPVNIKDLLIDSYVNSFRFICMFQILEHLDNLDEVFSSLNRLLKIGGHIFITVPNREQRVFFEKSGIPEDIPPVHVSRWSLQSFKYVEETYGLQVRDYQTQRSSYRNNFVRFVELQYQKTEASRNLNLASHNTRPQWVKYFNFLLLSVKYISPLLQMYSNKEMGVSQWVHLVKVSDLK
jgi:SAM-dependent methyltransferase